MIEPGGARALVEIECVSEQLAWQPLGHLQTREVGHVLQRVVQRIDKHLRRHGLFDRLDSDAALQDPEDHLAASASCDQQT